VTIVTQDCYTSERVYTAPGFLSFEARMALFQGTRLGQYEVIAPLGSGGMGEVYRARDTRLGREVAIKVLPADKLSDPTRRARFVHEARAASALNHHHIVTIYEIESAEGIDFIVMELVPGKTLDALIPPTGCGLARCCGSPSPWRTRWLPLTAPASSTAISSRRT
jgi:serine/threonine protein kinase